MSEPGRPEGDSTAGDGGVDGRPLDAGEAELLAAFDRLSPQGGLQWGFDDAMRRLDHPDIESAAGAEPWRGLPDDLWERGKSARVGQRFVGDVAGVMADILAADARAVADAAVEAVSGDRFVAAWDALRFLAARVEALEARVDPLGLEAAEWPGPVPDPIEWVDVIGTWLGSPDPRAPVVVGESGDGLLLDALAGSGWRVLGVEPRGASVWMSIDRLNRPEDHLSRPQEPGPPGAVTVLADVAEHLRTVPDNSAAGVVLAGCVDRVDLAGKLGLLDQSVRIVRPGGTIIVLVTDQSAWERELSIPARDLTPGRPLHPETWAWLLRRSGAVDPVWNRAGTGTLHAVVARLAS